MLFKFLLVTRTQQFLLLQVASIPVVVVLMDSWDMEQNHKKYAAFLTRLQEELMTAATQHSVAWRFGNWTARQRLLLVHERLLRDVRRNLQKLNNYVIKEAPDFRRAFGAEFQRWANQLPEPAKEQLSLLKEYTEVFAEPKRK